ncbi:hypothetical protein FKM82_020984, partial [Ascaphus truei]
RESVRGASSAGSEEGGAVRPQNGKPKQNLFTALLRLCHCQRGRLAVRAREALLGVLRAAQEEGPTRLIAQSELSQCLTEHLCDLHCNIPPSTYPSDITTQEGTDWRSE